MKLKPARLRFRFSLLFLMLAVAVAGFVAWLGSQVYLIQQRRAFLARNPRDVIFIEPRHHRLAQGTTNQKPLHDIPRIRQWLGDAPKASIVVENAGDNDKVRKLFPEVRVVVFAQNEQNPTAIRAVVSPGGQR